MSSVELFAYDVLKTRGVDGSGVVRSCAKTVALDIAHLSVVVYGEEIEYGDSGVNISMEPVRAAYYLI